MTVRTAVEVRLAKAQSGRADGLRVRLPKSLKGDPVCVRTAIFRRLAASRLFAYGDRARPLGSRQMHSAGRFRLDVSQRVVVKALVCRHIGRGAARSSALARHLKYLGRIGAGTDGAAPIFFTTRRDGPDATKETSGWTVDRHHFRFIVSPEHGDRISDLKDYARDVMARVSSDLDEPSLAWLGICHFDTDQPHVHLLIRGRRGDGRDLVIPRDYVSYGFRARAQEVAQERLGDLSRQEAERRLWRETEADRFTAFDRRLLAGMDSRRTVSDGIGGRDAWAALTRGRLAHLEWLGLASRDGHRFRLADDMESRLRKLQISRDVVRTLNQRRLEGCLTIQELEGRHHVRGVVTKTGFHDELGASPYVVIRSSDGREHYARTAVGTSFPKLGRTVTLVPGAHGLAHITSTGRAESLDRS